MNKHERQRMTIDRYAYFNESDASLFGHPLLEAKRLAEAHLRMTANDPRSAKTLTLYRLVPYATVEAQHPPEAAQPLTWAPIPQTSKTLEAFQRWCAEQKEEAK